VADEPVSAGDDIPPGSRGIEVYVRDLDQLFDSIDPSPFHRRTLDRDAEEFIVSSAKELPEGEPGRKSLIVGLPLLTASVLGSNLIAGLTQTLPLAVVLRESLVIGGWAAMSGPLEIFLYRWWPIRDQGRLNDRLSRMAIRIVYTGTGQADGARWSPGDAGGDRSHRPGSEAPQGV